MTDRSEVIVIGAGMAGLAAATELRAWGVGVRVLEKHSVPGGRLATRVDGGDRYDHGAAFFTVRDLRFAAALAEPLAAGLVRPWADRLHRWDGRSLVADPLTATVRRYAVPDGMNQLWRGLGPSISIEAGSRVTKLEPRDRQWRVHFLRGPAAEAAAVDTCGVVVALPAPQALELAATAGDAVDALVRAQLAQVVFDPCLVLLARFAGAPPPWRAIAVEQGPLQWIGLESSKRPAEGVLVAVHASGAWSREHWGAPDDFVVPSLTAELARVAGDGRFLQPERRQLKRWRYAKPTVLADARSLFSEAPPVAFCGDWAVAPRVEGAYLSGLAAAERLAGSGLI